MNVVAEEWRAENTGIESGVLETQQLGEGLHPSLRNFSILHIFPSVSSREGKKDGVSIERGGREGDLIAVPITIKPVCNRNRYEL